jgi:recombination endonuclease VII
MTAQPCKEPGCNLRKALPAHRCVWHDLLEKPIDEQIDHAIERRPAGIKQWGEHKTMPASSWPAGRRWCSGCNFMVPLFYVRGSRCIACTSHAAHDAHLRKEYGITYEEYLAVLKYQDYRCYICRKRPLKRRLAVDHDHRTNKVRGLLCSGERSCNYDILGNITGIDMARRIVLYMENPPFDAMRAGQALHRDVATAGPTVQGRTTTRMPSEASKVTPADTFEAFGTVEVMERMAAEALERRARAADSMKYSDGDWLRWPKAVWDAGEERTLLNAVPDFKEPKVWQRRLELFREKQAARAAR